ncbi:Ferroporti-1 [Dunaliella salina]|uniref:Solute carrier family 40 member n=1 Tax=Dunaliella salina TaxID=3046 RepID=A0ABQ7G549_DUNSA|nr:Ferroporti-1 [Dunaliella salina]|eukprot:KAF5829728.1 Ferroporti-1 [Dunaliella salina]
MSSADADGDEGQALLHNRQEAVQIDLPPSTHERSERDKAQKPLMLAYAMAAWAWRSWEFAVALLLIQLSSSSLRLVSVYGLADNFVRVAFGGSVGGYVGRRCIASGTRNFLLLQNACIAVSAACAAALLGFKEELGHSGWVRWILLASTIGCGATSSLGSLGIQIAIEKRAVQAMLRDMPSALAEANSGFRAIDLTCQLAAPIVIGLLMTYTSSLIATILLLGYTMLVWIPEVHFFQRAVHFSPPLRAISHHEGSQVDKGPCDSTATSSSSTSSWRSTANSVRAGFSAVLHRLAATAIFPMLAPRLGLRGTGLLGTYYQLAWLTLGLSPLVIVTILQPDKTPHVLGVQLNGQNLQRLLIAGLWTFDLAVTQLMQDLIAPEDLGLVSGVAGSLDSLFFSMSFIAALFVADPGLFFYLMVASWCLTACAASLYTIFYVRTSPIHEQ